MATKKAPKKATKSATSAAVPLIESARWQRDTASGSMTGTPSAWYLRADASDPTIAAAIEAGIARVRTRHGEGVVSIDQSAPLLTVRQGEQLWERRQTVTVPATDEVRAALSDHVTIPEGAESIDVVLAVPTVRINAARQVTPTADAKPAKSAAAAAGSLPAHLAQFLTD